ncbi:a1712a35-3b15-4d51-9b6c-1a5176de3cc6 [Thermothielavioides terrestris]|uniref:DUF7137 domain-containing protein n=2 Tax=Thermothielavioides terrestris TaxID=2587410 RepID=G2R9W4_THETT|nr:uncharacterized protein THITE_2171085 [Thermothielavioides terrestris NRRL 8126]AEO69605.1 hypothetical protein THITE_2171085 [Thermothielavioides terrestris NRRL 8126]SPQ26122.1 a1712a35-3b15-4d51-9b6c-1a5176de3cc6 [Thermothielavioides terrestris]
MKSSLSAAQLAVTLLSVTRAVSAVSWPTWLPELDSLVVRRDDSSSQDSPSPTPTPAPTASGDNNNGDSTSSGFPLITTNLNTGGITPTGSGTAHATGNRTSSHAPKKTQFNPQDPAGSVVMVTPAATDGLQLYKIGDYVTWGWNYTNLLADPTAIDLYVKCSSVAQPWTVTQNMSFQEPGSFTWDTKAFQSSHVADPLLTEMYTLVIADADGGISATAEPGYLAPYSGFTFGLYEPQEYHDTGDGYQCASCSRAVSGLDRRAVGVAVVMSALTVLSFTWFVAGFGAFV